MVLKEYDILLNIGKKRFRFKGVEGSSKYAAQRKLLDSITIERIELSKPDPIEESTEVQYFKNLFGMK